MITSLLPKRYVKETNACASLHHCWEPKAAQLASDCVAARDVKTDVFEVQLNTDRQSLECQCLPNDTHPENTQSPAKDHRNYRVSNYPSRTVE